MQEDDPKVSAESTPSPSFSKKNVSYPSKSAKFLLFLHDCPGNSIKPPRLLSSISEERVGWSPGVPRPSFFNSCFPGLPPFSHVSRSTSELPSFEVRPVMEPARLARRCLDPIANPSSIKPRKRHCTVHVFLRPTLPLRMTIRSFYVFASIKDWDSLLGKAILFQFKSPYPLLVFHSEEDMVSKSFRTLFPSWQGGIPFSPFSTRPTFPTVRRVLWPPVLPTPENKWFFTPYSPGLCAPPGKRRSRPESQIQRLDLSFSRAPSRYHLPTPEGIPPPLASPLPRNECETTYLKASERRFAFEICDIFLKRQSARLWFKEQETREIYYTLSENFPSRSLFQYSCCLLFRF